jgi:short-subunit dehydrogenase
MMKNVALITGASSGLGKEFAKIHASRGGDLVLVARREIELNSFKMELQKNYNISVEVFPIDLTQADAVENLINNLESKGIQIDVLINNAGFGGYGNFHERELNRELEMIRLNIEALTKLTHYLLPQMLKRNAGYILNVASVAGFMPGPLQSVYFATKAFVVSFTQGVATEISGSGVKIAALCPGPVHTGFENAAGLAGGNLFKGAAQAHKTALIGYNGMLKGRRLIFNQWMYRFLINWIAPLVPRKMLAKTVMNMQRLK